MSDHTFRLTVLDGARPADYLAALGLACLDPEAHLVFDGRTPILSSDRDPAELATLIADGIEARTAPDRFPFPGQKGFNTTTPEWNMIADLARRSWEEPVVDATLHTVEVGEVNKSGDRKKKADPAKAQVPSATLILITGKSYTRNALTQLWPDPEGGIDPVVHRHTQRAELRTAVEDLLGGRQPAVRAGALVMRFTATEGSPKVRLGSPEAVVVPVIELLAFIGATQLLPHQLGIPLAQPERPRAGLTWALNPIPLTGAAMATIHDHQTPPPDWLRFSAVSALVAPKANARSLVDIRQVEAL